MAALVGVGALLGATLVLALPSTVFARVVPWLIVAACALVVAQPYVVRALRSRGVDPTSLPRRALVPVLVAIGIYAGYFGAAQGIILIAALGSLYDADLQSTNAAKNVLQGVSNTAAAIAFAVAGAVDWPAAIAVGAGAALGGAHRCPVRPAPAGSRAARHHRGRGSRRRRRQHRAALTWPTSSRSPTSMTLGCPTTRI